jgi:hypothetical protein
MSFHRRTVAALALTAVMLIFAGASFGADVHTTNSFSGVKVSGGTVTHSKQDDKNVLTLSDDFKVPETPDALAGGRFKRQRLSTRSATGQEWQIQQVNYFAGLRRGRRKGSDLRSASNLR